MHVLKSPVTCVYAVKGNEMKHTNTQSMRNNKRMNKNKPEKIQFLLKNLKHGKCFTIHLNEFTINDILQL